jgi:WD40 repeat protein
VLENEFKAGGLGSAAKLKELGLNGNADGKDLMEALVAEAGDAIPREPERSRMMGHRARITRVAFHPIYTVLASSSEDAAIKLWDYETGECE